MGWTAGRILSNSSIKAILAESKRVTAQYSWEGTFADYLELVVENPGLSRLSHKLIYESIADTGIEESPRGAPVYKLFDGEIFGLDDQLDRLVQYFSSGADRFDIRKRILLMIGPPASGKSTIVALIKKAIERYTRTEAGAAYAIKGCPMQEEPLHLIPREARPKLMEEFGIYVEGDLCPRCRYTLRSKYGGKIGEVPVTRFVFSEQEAMGIGFYVATNPNPADASLLTGSVDASQLEGDRVEVAGKAFRMDGELNVGNRGLVEFGEIFKADQHLLSTLLGLAQEQLIKMERFGSVYVDEVVIGHSNVGDLEIFLKDESSEALKDRLIAIQVPYNVRVGDEIKIYRKMLSDGLSQSTHLAPLTLATAQHPRSIVPVGTSGSEGSEPAGQAARVRRADNAQRFGGRRTRHEKTPSRRRHGRLVSPLRHESAERSAERTVHRLSVAAEGPGRALERTEGKHQSGPREPGEVPWLPEGLRSRVREPGGTRHSTCVQRRV